LPPDASAPTATAPAAEGTAANAAPAQSVATKSGFDLLGNPVAPLGQKKSFVLDPLLR
jgi:hypothetical protein